MKVFKIEDFETPETLFPRVIAFNGSPRKEWNTATLLKNALEGAESQGAETELVHLYDLDYKGCMSCFACKMRGGKSQGKCAVNDDLTPFLKKVEEADAIILGSPIYVGIVTGEMRSFMERLIFPYANYSNPSQPFFPKKINFGFIYTANITEEFMKEHPLGQLQGQLPPLNEMYSKGILGPSESLFSFDTYQFEDYSKVEADFFDEKQKAKRRKEVFPEDCKKAFEMGTRMASRD